MIGLAITKYVFKLNIRLQSYKIPIKREQKNEFYLPSVRNFWPTMKKCVGVGLLTRDWSLVKTAYRAFMAQRELIETAINHYTILRTWGYAMPESTSSNMRRPT